MGAHTFTATMGGKRMTPNEAYDALVLDAKHQHGHDPYNGTISTTSGYAIVDLPKGRSMDKLIRDILDAKHPDYQHIAKWGPAGCIELRGKALRDWKAAHGLEGTRARAYVFFGWAAS